uniref:Uncharacterized protein n=1 Tax=Panagrolaimus sp. JU765 TaxID=591449 RepID=A0AC34QA16_9BILA
MYSCVDDVKIMMTEFSQLSELTIDDVEFLEKISGKSDKFFKSAGPVAALVASSMNNNFQRDSDEYKAIELFRSEMHQQFKTLERRLQPYRKHSEIILANSYGEMVSDKLNSLQDMFEIFVEPSAKSETRKEHLYEICIDFRPLSVLTFLKRVLIGECPLPSEEDINIYVRTREAFRLLESRWKDQNIEFSNGKDYFEKKE